MFALLTQFDEKYLPLADLTWYENKIPYAEKYGYRTFFINALENAWDKIKSCKELFENYPEIEWIWFTGCDTLITNMGIRIEDKIDNNYHFIIAVDHAGINSDSFLVRNSPEGIALLDDVESLEQEYIKYWDSEQRALAHTLGLPGTETWHDPELWPAPGPISLSGKHKNNVLIVPQRYMNSYNRSLYKTKLNDIDKLGYNGEWQQGDWLVHWPALSIEERISAYYDIKDKIII